MQYRNKTLFCKNHVQHNWWTAHQSPPIRKSGGYPRSQPLLLRSTHNHFAQLDKSRGLSSTTQKTNIYNSKPNEECAHCRCTHAWVDARWEKSHAAAFQQKGLASSVLTRASASTYWPRHICIHIRISFSTSITMGTSMDRGIN